MAGRAFVFDDETDLIPSGVFWVVNFVIGGSVFTQVVGCTGCQQERRTDREEFKKLF